MTFNWHCCLTNIHLFKLWLSNKSKVVTNQENATYLFYLNHQLVPYSDSRYNNITIATNPKSLHLYDVVKQNNIKFLQVFWYSFSWKHNARYLGACSVLCLISLRFAKISFFVAILNVKASCLYYTLINTFFST